jgi:tetratricopeptide (TPR) repeat protein
MQPRIKVALITCVILFVSVTVFSFISKEEESVESRYIENVDRRLSDEAVKIYEERLKKVDEALSQAQDREARFESYMSKGFTLDGLGRLKDARDTFMEASTLFPEDHRPYKALFQIKLEMTDLLGAKEDGRKALKLAPDDTDLWIKYIEAESDKYKASNDIISATYSEALVKTNFHIDIITSYASWLERVGNLQASREYWEKAIVVNPGAKKIYEAEINRIDKVLKQQQ